MNLKPVLQSSQKEKNKYHTLTYIHIASREMVMISLFAEQQWRCRQTEQTCGYSGERE